MTWKEFNETWLAQCLGTLLLALAGCATLVTLHYCGVDITSFLGGIAALAVFLWILFNV